MNLVDGLDSADREVANTEADDDSRSGGER